MSRASTDTGDEKFKEDSPDNILCCDCNVKKVATILKSSFTVSFAEGKTQCVSHRLEELYPTHLISIK
jgi:hypothetical protein